jgi:hypothetical protein
MSAHRLSSWNTHPNPPDKSMIAGVPGTVRVQSGSRLALGSKGGKGRTVSVLSGLAGIYELNVNPIISHAAHPAAMVKSVRTTMLL